MKKILSVLLSLVLTINVFAVMTAAPMEAEAADYAATLRSQGFPESYIPSLVSLHNKYPNWIFKPLKTNMNFQTAVNAERKNHSNQLIEKLSSTDSSMYCNCSLCMKNGNYVIQEASNWISASEKAVQYYMDPRNFLNEQGIFQFESTQYNGTQSKTGVEAILKGTWMYNSKISYSNTEGQQTTMGSTYSSAIMDAAQNSGMSAYYLASKIKQEVGGTSPTAGGASGKVSPFQGIFNYYNISAYTGAMDGLEWAAGYLRTNKETTLYSGYDWNAKKGTGTQTKLKAAQYMTLISYCDNNYYKVRLYNENNFAVGAVGYVAKSDIRTTYIGDTSSGWGRPWYTPYLSIYYGAKYIAKNFGTQYTGYLQKFNVNPASGSAVHTHEYMRNVAGAASEAKHTYSAYKNAGILSLTNTFYIPVYNNMPVDTLPSVTGLKASSSSTNQINLTWNAISDATGYRIMINKNGTYEVYANVSTNKVTVTGLNPGQIYGFKVIACADKGGGKIVWGQSWTECSYAPMLSAVTGLSTTVVSTNQLDVKWNKLNNVTGYKVEINKNGKYEEYATVYSNSVSIKGLTGGQEYSIRVRGFRNYYSNTYWGISWSTTSNTTILNPVTGLKATGSDANSISLEWNRVANATGYRVLYYKNGKEIYNDVADNKIKITGLNANNSSYQIKVIAFKKHSGKTYWGTWSNITVQTNTSNLANVTGIKAQNQTTSSVEFTWNTVANATGYKVQFNNGGTFVDYATVSGNKVTVTGLSPGQICSIRIKAYTNRNGAAVLSNSWSECTNAATLETVTNIKVKDAGNGQLHLTWNQLGCVTGYRVQISTNGNYGNDFVTTYTNSITLKNLKLGQNYSIRILGFRNFNGSTYWSKGWAYTTGTSSVLTPVTGIKTVSSSNAVDVTWTPVPAATGYRILIERNGSYETYANVSAPNVTIKNLKPSQKYAIKIIACSNQSDAVYWGSSWTQATIETKA